MAKQFFSPGHYTRLIHSGSQYFESLCHLIDGAERTLHLQVYILEKDDTGHLIIEHLKKAAERSVTVYVLADGYASSNLSKPYVKALLKSGIHFRFFSPLRYPFPINAGRRLHHKVCVADGKKALIGGINIGDKYKGSESEKAWLDYALYIEGPVAYDAAVACMKNWRRRFRKEKNDAAESTHVRSGGLMARLMQNDFLRRRNEVSASYKQRLRGAHHSIIIIASYFLPTRRLLKILTRSALRGREVNIILSQKSDVPFIKPAMAYLYKRLLGSGIKIYEYTEAVLHAKAAVVDNRWMTIGSHNLTHLSEFLSVETNVEVLDKTFVEQFAGELQLLMKHHCEEITLDDYQRKETFFINAKNWFSYKLVSMSQRLLELMTSRPV